LRTVWSCRSTPAVAATTTPPSWRSLAATRASTSPRTDYVARAAPAAECRGDGADLTVILFTLDETAYARELAPLPGVYPALKLGPRLVVPRQPEGMRRFREMTTETAGFYNTVGFNDDTRAFCRSPRGTTWPAGWTAPSSPILSPPGGWSDEAFEVAHDLAYGLAKAAYRL
jgi:glucuronate isomerase